MNANDGTMVIGGQAARFQNSWQTRFAAVMAMALLGLTATALVQTLRTGAQVKASIATAARANG